MKSSEPDRSAPPPPARPLALTIGAAARELAEAIVRAAFDCGYTLVALAPELDERDWRRLRPLLPRRTVAAIALGAPRPPGRRLNEPSVPFGALDRTQRDETQRRAERSVTLADELEAPVILVPRAELDDAALRAADTEPRHRRAPDADASDPASARLRKLREEVSTRYLDAYRSSLDRLLSFAERYAVRLALSPANRWAQVPNTAEADRLLVEFAGGPLGLWADTSETKARAPVTEATGAEATGALLGATLRDVDAQGAIALPGRGALDWTEHLRAVAHAPLWLIDPPRDARSDDLEAAAATIMAALETEPPKTLW